MKSVDAPVFGALACAVVAGALWCIGYAAASSFAKEGKRLGLRGLKRERALQRSPLWAQVEPIVHWLGTRLSPLLSDNFRQDLNRKIALAGDYLGLLPEEVVSLSLLTGIGGVGIGSLLGSISGLGDILMIAFGMFGTLVPYFRITGAASERMKDVNRRLPYAIDLLALGMGAGLDFPGAVRQVIEKSGRPDEPLVEEFTLMLQSLQLGRTRQQALEEFAQRVPVDAVVEFVGSVVQAELRGNPVVTVLRIQAEVSRRKRSVRAEEAAAKAGVAMMVPLVLVFLAILLLLISPVAIQLQGTLS
jgi:tight adherence protein C